MPDSVVLTWLANALVQYGPVVLFVACLLETAMFIGLIVPVGGMIALSAMLASRGVFPPEGVAIAAVTGAFLGDQLGFAVGRWFVTGARPRQGRISRVWQAALSRTELLLSGRGMIGISIARGVPFVRTIMPWFVGRSRIAWPRYVLFDLLGVAFWAVIYIGGGFLAGQGWQQVAAQYGEEIGAVAAVLLIVALLLLVKRALGPPIPEAAPGASPPDAT